MPMNIQFFAEPGEQVDDFSALDSLLDGMTGDGTPPPAANTDPGTETPPATADGTPPATPPAPEQQPGATPPATRTQGEKQQFAFGELRKQNSELLGIMKNLAKANGIEYTTNNELVTKLQQQSLELQAKKDNVPVELLQRMNTLEMQNKIYEEQRAQEKLTSDFVALATDYNLSADELTSFATELDSMNINITDPNVNIVGMYRMLHFDAIVSKLNAAAVEAALKKSSEADSHSSIPGAPGSGANGTGAKIQNVHELDAFLNGMKL